MMLLEWHHILTGLGIGMIMSAPVGPVNFLCFHRTLHRGLVPGLMVGLGAMLADSFFASIAIFGLKFASQLIEENIEFLQVVGGALIIGFGIYLLKHKPQHPHPPKGKQKTWAALAGGFVLTFSNPGNFIGFAAMFSGITDVIADEPSLFNGANLVFGVALGALLWWSAFAGLTWYFRKKMTQGVLMKINRTAGVLILLSGFLLVGRYLMDFIPGFTGG
jgi:threonine/homoserine/homoserine lactone efflux protein